MGIGLGTGYLSPVKTLMLWFKDRKGLATGLASFASVIVGIIFVTSGKWKTPKIKI